jgi:very-short-patch-repair endonuclease
VDVTYALAQCGGIASRSELLKVVTRGDLDMAVRSGAVVRPTRGRYALPTELEAKQAAQAMTGVAILLSAASHWGWRRKWEPRMPQVAVPRGRRVAAEVRDRYDIRWRAIPSADVVDGWVTTRLRTLVDAAVLLPFDEALSIADSALRSGSLRRSEALARAQTLDPQLRPRVVRVLKAADPHAANPFESVLRAIALEVSGLHVRTQVRIDDDDGFVGRVDLADEHLRIVIEADSVAFHGDAQAMDRDFKRYDRLVAAGWLVLRFSWNQVMTKAAWVASVISAAVRLRRACTCAGPSSAR